MAFPEGLSHCVENIETTNLRPCAIVPDNNSPFVVYTEAGVTFSPDDFWAILGRKGIEMAIRKHPNPTVAVEYGVGTGAALLVMAQESRTRQLIACDINPDVLKITHLNICTNPNIVMDKTVRLHLIGTLPPFIQELTIEGIQANIVYFCLPQVPVPNDIELSNGEANNYYDASIYPTFHEWGLGLVATALEYSKPILAPDGKVVLVLSGRIPLQAKQDMIAQAGFSGDVLLCNHVQQDPFTLLKTLKGNDHITLFEMLNGEMRPISIEEAIRRQEEAGLGNPANVYHGVEVWEVNPTI